MKASALMEQLLVLSCVYGDLEVATEGCDCWGTPDAVTVVPNFDGRGTPRFGITRPDGVDAVQRTSTSSPVGRATLGGAHATRDGERNVASSGE